MGYVIYNENTPQVRGVLFDMDGVVLDTEVLYTRFWMEACHFYGYPMTREQALGMRSLGAADGERNLRRWFGPEVNYHAVRASTLRSTLPTSQARGKLMLAMTLPPLAWTAAAMSAILWVPVRVVS